MTKGVSGAGVTSKQGSEEAFGKPAGGRSEEQSGQRRRRGTPTLTASYGEGV